MYLFLLFNWRRNCRQRRLVEQRMGHGVGEYPTKALALDSHNLQNPLRKYLATTRYFCAEPSKNFGGVFECSLLRNCEALSKINGSFSKIRRAAQKIIGAAEITGERFLMILAAFPMIIETSGRVREAYPMIKRANPIVSETA